MTRRERSQEIKPGVAAPGMAERLGTTIDERRGVEYHELRAKELVNKFNGRPMPFGWTVNPYRGCEMACRYCFARYTHGFLGLDDRGAFERTIYVKDSDPDRLVAELRRARRSGRIVAIGTATDPYQPAEARFAVTRRVLEAARAVPGLHLSITTKSTLVARDAELLRELSASSDVTVNLSITTVDGALARRLEPRAPRPDLRFAAMKELADAGVAARLFIMPILPRLTDHEDNLRPLLLAPARPEPSAPSRTCCFCARARGRSFSSSWPSTSRDWFPTTSASITDPRTRRPITFARSRTAFVAWPTRSDSAPGAGRIGPISGRPAS